MLRSAVALALVLAMPAAWAASETPATSASSSGNYVASKSAASTTAGSAAAVANKAPDTGSSSPQSHYQSGRSADSQNETEPDNGSVGQKAGNAATTPVHYRDERVLAASGQKTTQKEAARPDTVTLRSSSYGFRLWDAGRDLISDVDADGYFRRFEIRFDADVSSGDAKVYAKLYLRRVGDTGPWEHYYTTDDFWIYGNSDSDDYYVDTTLNDGYPTGDYDVLIDLYEVGYSGIVATIGPFEDASLRDLRLEDAGLDIPLPNAGYHINDVDTTLLIDSDHDGYYSKFSISFDPDRDFGASMAYAVLRVRADDGNWQTEHTSEVFQVDESGDADRFSFTGDWLSGYITSRYDVQIDLYDAASNLLVATVSSERPELSRVPLEDAGRDTVANGGSNGGGGSSHSSESGGGGSMSWLLLGVVAGLIFARWRSQRDRLLQKARNKPSQPL
ncbi:hypothetical protein HPT27_08825 [Permianibacter sp. IMCC34836]|uniref:choice-of-anchor H family protein n=1 Tax=Permianibacter fluminis TaxID=2738515 RepID=UPI001556BB09|nr:choice-of-anchor H family protein [Permianibacter fluminis]NQD37127.1 hypothetical protein [Permianibacter fluminis]